MNRGVDIFAGEREYMPLIRKILFVCVHNSGRSQMACAFTNNLGDGHVIAQCSGTMPGGSVNPRVVHAMKEVGLDLSANIPCVITQSQVDEAHVVITMGCSVEGCPISDFQVDQDWKLEDPHDLPIEDVRRIRDDIRFRVTSLLESLSTNW
jgi:arsenate reductase